MTPSAQPAAITLPAVITTPAEMDARRQELMRDVMSTDPFHSLTAARQFETDHKRVFPLTALLPSELARVLETGASPAIFPGGDALHTGASVGMPYWPHAGKADLVELVNGLTGEGLLISPVATVGSVSISALPGHLGASYIHVPFHAHFFR